MFATVSVYANEKKIEQLDIQQPRTFGYQIGDKFDRIIKLKLNLPYVLDDSVLPKHGRITEWLTLEKPIVDLTIEDGVPQYHIKLHYQIINIKPELVDIAVPSHMLIYKNSDTDEKLNALIPATRIRVSALTDSNERSLQADRMPITVEQTSGRLFLYLALIFASIIGFLYLKFGLPVFNKNHPFAKAHQVLKSRRHKIWDEVALSEALQTIHQAFNETAEKTVFIEKLDEFFSEHQEFTVMENEIALYFSESRTYFFEGKTDQESFKYSRDALIDFTQKCSEAERGIS